MKKKLITYSEKQLLIASQNVKWRWFLFFSISLSLDIILWLIDGLRLLPISLYLRIALLILAILTLLIGGYKENIYKEELKRREDKEMDEMFLL